MYFCAQLVPHTVPPMIGRLRVCYIGDTTRRGDIESVMSSRKYVQTRKNFKTPSHGAVISSFYSLTAFS